MTENIDSKLYYLNKLKAPAVSPKPPLRRATYATGLLLIGLGFVLGHFFFPKEVTRTVYIDKRVEVPIERIVERRVEVPVEVIKHIERTGENKPAASEVPIERIVERRVEVPVEVIKYVERTSENKPAALATQEKNAYESANHKGNLTRIAADSISVGRTPAQRFTAEKANVRKGMSKAEVEDTLGAPSEVVEANGNLYWYYSDKERRTGGVIVLRSEGLFNPYKVIEVTW